MKVLEKELEQIYNDVFFFVVSGINNEEIAKDITQSVMESACKNISKLRKKDAFKAWVMQIARNKINDHYRKMNKVLIQYDDISSEKIEELSIEEVDVEDVKADILQKLIHEEDMINIMLALERLEKKYQDVIRLNIICEYNLIDTAEALNQNINTVRTWSARGLVKLREEFEKIEAGNSK